MTQLRERWEGVSLPGDYLLQLWLSGDEAAGFFETSLARDGRRAIVKLVPEFAGDGAAQLALWQRTRSLRHPNLRELLDCGRAELAGGNAFHARVRIRRRYARLRARPVAPVGSRSARSPRRGCRRVGLPAGPGPGSSRARPGSRGSRGRADQAFHRLAA